MEAKKSNIEDKATRTKQEIDRKVRSLKLCTPEVMIPISVLESIIKSYHELINSHRLMDMPEEQQRQTFIEMGKYVVLRSHLKLYIEDLNREGSRKSFRTTS